MQLFRLTTTTLQEIEKTTFALEREIQSLLEKNLKNIFNLEFVATELAVGRFRFDTVAYDSESTAFVIIEYKKTTNSSVIDQGFTYLSVMLDRKAELVNAYNAKKRVHLTSKDIDWTQSRVIFISPSFTTFQRESVNFKDIPFELWEIKKFGNNIISFEQCKTTPTENISRFSRNDPKIARVTDTVAAIDESVHLTNCNQATIDLWESLKSRLLDLGDINTKVLKIYVAIRRGNTTVCYVYFRRASLAIVMLPGQFRFHDPAGLLKTQISTKQTGEQSAEYHLQLKTNQNLEQCLLLIKQKYDSLER
jgi:predicted transport protein